MRISLRQLLALVAVAALLCLLAKWFLDARATDRWAYGKLGISNGTPQSAVFSLDVRGVGGQPTVVRIVRFPAVASAPRNYLIVPESVSVRLDAHTRNSDRWTDSVTVLAGRNIEEAVELKIDNATVRQLFAPPGTYFDDFTSCEKFWSKYIAANMPTIPLADQQ